MQSPVRPQEAGGGIGSLFRIRDTGVKAKLLALAGPLSFLLCLCAPAVPAAGATSTPIAKVNGWSINDLQGQCSATGAFEGETIVHITYDFGRDSAMLSVFNPAWESIKDGAEYKIDLTFSDGSEYQDTTAAGLRIDDAGSRLTGVRLHLDGSDFLGDFAGTAAMRMTMDDVLVDSFSLKGTSAVIARLRQCAIASYKRYPPDPFASAPPASTTSPGQAGPGRAMANLATLFSDEDYPAAALRAEEQGTVGFRLDVGADGRVTNCSITSTSGSASLDSTTCRLLRSRARFNPARDSNGNATTDSTYGRITWRLPVDAPPTPVPAPPTT